MSDADFRVVEIDYGSFDYHVLLKIRDITLRRPLGMSLIKG